MEPGANLKYKLKIVIACILLYFGVAERLMASHIMGGSLTYKYVGGQKYEVELSFYRDCSNPANTGFPDSLNLNIKGISTSSLNIINLPKVTEPVKIPSPLNNCANEVFCSEVAYYRTTVTLWDDMGGFHLWVGTRERNYIITNYAKGDIIWYTYIPPLQIVNASPNIVKHAVPFLCAGKEFNFNAGFYDPDGDSLVFSFAIPYSKGTPPDFSPLVLRNGYSLDYPFGRSSWPLSIDRSTGLLTGKAANTGNYVIVVQIDEYRKNRFTNQFMHIGTVRIDLQMVVLNCLAGAALPKWNPDPNGLIRSVSLGDTVEIKVGGTDIDDDLLNISAYGSMLGSITEFPKPWATFQKKQEMRKASGTFSWVPSCEHITTSGPHIVTFILTDKSCNTVEQSYQIFVNYELPEDLRLELGNDTVFCEGDTLVLDAGMNAIWDDSSSGRYRKVFEPGEYWAYYSPFEGCKINHVSDNILVSMKKEPLPLKNRNFTICPEDTALDPGGAPGLTYTWSTGLISDLLHVNSAGTYYVEISNGYCTFMDSVVVKEFSSDIIDLGGDTFLCIGDTIFLDAHFNKVRWEDGSTGRFRKIFKEGTYTAYYKPFPKCEVSHSIFIAEQHKPKPVPNKYFSICAGDTVLNSGGDPNYSYLWSTGDTSPLFEVSAAGVYYVQISNGSCTILDSVVVSEYDAIPMDLGQDILTCELPVMLDAGYENSVWQDGSKSRFFMAAYPGNYHATYISPKGCMATDSIIVTLAGIPDIDIGQNRFACAGEAVILNAGADAKLYIWNTGATTREITVWKPGTYWLKAFSEHCLVYDSVYVNYLAVPRAQLPHELFLCPLDGETLTLKAGSEYACLWEPGGQTDRELIVSDTGIYTLNLFNELGCYTTARIVVKDGCKGTLYIPNVFTPDDDNLNERFCAEGTYIYSFIMTIYNRWGERLFESDNIREGWDGTHKGKPLPGGTYLYSISAEAKGGSIYKSGVVNLIR